MSEIATITGTISYPLAPGGPTVSPVLGAPVVNPTSTTKPQLDFNEVAGGTFKLLALATHNVDFQTLAAADCVYIGTDQQVTVTLNGGVTTHILQAGGFILMFKAGVTAISITAGPLAATVQVTLLGD